MSFTFSSCIVSDRDQAARLSASPSPARCSSALNRSAAVSKSRRGRKGRQHSVAGEVNDLKQDIDRLSLRLQNIETYRACTRRQPYLRWAGAHSLRYNVPAEREEEVGWGSNAANGFRAKARNRISIRTKKRVQIPSPRTDSPMGNSQSNGKTIRSSTARDGSGTGPRVGASSDCASTRAPIKTSYDSSILSSLDEKPSTSGVQTASSIACDNPVIVSPLPTRRLSPQALCLDGLAASSLIAAPCSLFSSDEEDTSSSSDGEGVPSSIDSSFSPVKMIKTPTRIDWSAGEICLKFPEKFMSLMSCPSSREPGTAGRTKYPDNFMSFTSSMLSCDAESLLDQFDMTSISSSVPPVNRQKSLEENWSWDTNKKLDYVTKPLPGPPKTAEYIINESPRDITKAPSTHSDPTAPATITQAPTTTLSTTEHSAGDADIPNTNVEATQPLQLHKVIENEVPSSAPQTITSKEDEKDPPQDLSLMDRPIGHIQPPPAYTASEGRDFVEPSTSYASSSQTTPQQPAPRSASKSPLPSGSSRSVSMRKTLAQIYSVDRNGDYGDKLKREYDRLDCASGGADGPSQFERMEMGLEGSRCAPNVIKKHEEEKRREKEERNSKGVRGLFFRAIGKRKRVSKGKERADPVDEWDETVEGTGEGRLSTVIEE